MDELCWINTMQPQNVGYLAGVRTGDTMTVWRKHGEGPWIAITPAMPMAEHEQWYHHRNPYTEQTQATQAQATWLEEHVASLVVVTA